MAENPLIPDDEEQVQPEHPAAMAPTGQPEQEMPPEAPQEAAEAPQEAPVPTPQETPEAAPEAPEAPPEASQEVDQELGLDESSWDLDADDQRATYGVLEDGTVRPREPDEDPEEYRVGMLKLMERAITDNQTVATGRQLIVEAQNAALQPDYLKYEDPDFEVPEEDLRGLPYHMKDILWDAKNKEHYAVLKKRVDHMKTVEQEWANSSWAEYLTAGTISVLTEGTAIYASTVALGPLGVSAAAGRAAQGIQRMTGLANGSRRLALLNGAALGAAGTAIEAGAAYNMNVVSARDAALQPVLGLMFGGAAGGIAGSIAKRAEIKKKSGSIEINEDLRVVEHADEAVARIERAEREAGIKREPGNPDAPKHPLENHPQVQQELSPDGIKNPVEPTVKAREVIFKEDANMKVRERGQAASATTMWVDDLEALDANAFRATSVLDSNTPKQNKRVGDAFRRQGYRNMEPKTVYMVVSKAAHKFAKETGEKMHVAYRSLADAKGEAPEGATFVRVRVPAGAKILEGGAEGLHESVGVPGQIFIGNGKTNPVKGTDGKPKARAEDGDLVQEMEWRPDAEIRGKPSLLGGVLPNGQKIGDDLIKAHNNSIDDLADDIDLDELSTAGADGGAARFVSAETSEITLDKIDEVWAKNPELAPLRETWLKGLSRIGRLVRSKNPLYRSWAQKHLGGIIDPNRRNREGGVAQVISSEEKMDAWTQAEHSQLNRGYKSGLRAWKQANKGNYKHDRDAKLKFNRTVHMYRAFLNEGKPIPAKYDVPGVKDWSDQLDQFYEMKLNQLKDPALAVQETSGTYQAVAGSEDIVFKKGHMPHRINRPILGKLKQEGYHRVLRDLYQQLLYENAAKKGYSGSPKDFEQLAGYIEEVKWLTHGKGTDSFGKAMMNAGNTRQFMEILQSTNHGLPQNKLDDLEATIQKIFDGFKGSSKDLHGRLDVDVTRTVKIPKRDAAGNAIPNSDKDIALIDLLDDNSLGMSKHYSRKHNGWLGLATTVETDPNGAAIMVSVPDPKNPDQMIQVPKTIRSRGDIHRDLERAAKMDKALGIQEDARGMNVNRGGEGVLDQSDHKVMKQFFEYMVAESGENPWAGVEFLKRIGYARTLGGGALSSLQEIGSLIGHNGIRGIMRLPAVRQAFTTLVDHVNMARKGQKDMRFIHQATQDLYDIGVGDTVGRMEGSANFEYGADTFRHGEMPGDESSFFQKSMYQAERFQNATLKWGGLLPFQDYLQMRSAEAFLDEGFVRFRKGGKMANRHKRKWNAAGLSDQDIADLQKMFKSKGVSHTRELGPYSQFLGVNRSHPDFNAQAYEKMLMAVRRMTIQKSIMEQKYGSQISGTDSAWWGAVTALKTYTIGSYSQQMVNWASQVSEDAAGMVRQGARGNFSMTDGMGDHLAGLYNNTKIATSTMIGAVLIGYLKDVENNWEKSDKWWEARTRRYLEDPEFMLQIGIDRGGLFSGIPLAYDHTLAPLLGLPDWNGFSIDDPASEMAFGNAPLGILKHAREAGSDILDASVQGRMTTNQFKKVASLPTNLIFYKQGVKLAAEGLKEAGILAPGKEWDPVKSKGPISQIFEKAGEKRSADWRLKKDLKNVKKLGGAAKSILLGDD